MNTRSIIWGIFAGLMMFGGAARADTGAAEKAVTAAEHQWMKAQQTNNTELLAPLFAEKIVVTDHDGKVLSGKAAVLADAKSTVYSSMDYTDLKVTAFGDTAIATGTYNAKETAEGKPLELRGRFTDTWVMANGKWLCVASHDSVIKK